MPVDPKELDRLRELAGIMNTETQLLAAAKSLALKQVDAAGELMRERQWGGGIQEMTEIAKIIATNMASATSALKT